MIQHDRQPFIFNPPEPSVEPTARWIRVKFGGSVIADSKQALLLRQYGPAGLPTYYFPLDDVRSDALVPASATPSDNGKTFWNLQVGDQIAENAAWRYQVAPQGFEALQGYVSFNWQQMDGWFEEEEEIFVHARDPHQRIDVLASSRHVRVEIAGVTVAETRRPWLLFETNLPTRYYIQQEDVCMDLLEVSKLKTRCPYKGIARYWSANINGYHAKNVVWSYPDPIPENPKIKDLMCFFNERVDIYVDGELEPRPQTPWSE